MSKIWESQHLGLDSATQFYGVKSFCQQSMAFCSLHIIAQNALELLLLGDKGPPQEQCYL